MKIIVSIVLLFIASVGRAECGSALTKDVTTVLWEEAVEAELNIVSLRIASEALISSTLNQKGLHFNFKDETGNDIAGDINHEKFKELVEAWAPAVSDFFHFGVEMRVAVQKVDSGVMASLITEVSSTLAPEVIREMSQQIAMQTLYQKEGDFPSVFASVRKTVAKTYRPIHHELKQKGVTHEELYKQKHAHIEINNYAAKVLRKNYGYEDKLGFLPIAGKDQGNKLKTIGFIQP